MISKGNNELSEYNIMRFLSHSSANFRLQDMSSQKSFTNSDQYRELLFDIGTVVRYLLKFNQPINEGSILEAAWINFNLI